MNDPRPPAEPSDPTLRLPPRGGVADLMRGLLEEDEAGTGGTASPEDATVKLSARPAPAASPSPSLPGTVREGVRIGNYVLKEKLGQGGFGTVWRAEQVAPFKRDVALKIILHGMDTEEVIARFEAEKKLLAKMDHPNIASVYDAGATDTGRPYFVMELVKGAKGPGLPITKYCNEKQLSIRERVELFIPVCQAVQHAHMKQVLHRDLKPTNILVAEVDGQPVPKIIDFGIAKAMSPDDEELLASRLRTAQDMVVGTLQYMSPEQAGAAQDIDTRSDVYTLGIILYEMLVGEPPIGKEEVKKAVFDVLRMIRDATPPRRPSTRWLTATDAQKETARATHRADPRRLSQEIHGDLDWIVLKALEKDRTRRYSAAMEFAEDLSRFLRHEPVSAGPPSAGYRLRKLIKRHKVAFAASVAVLGAIVIGGSIAAWQWQVAAKARDAEVAARRSAEQARASAEEAQALAERRESEARTARELEAKARELESQARRLAEEQRQAADTARSQAEEERGIAQTARSEAEGLINYMLFDLRDRLEPLNRIALLDEVAKKSEAYFKAQPADGETDSQRRNRGGMWQNRGQIALAMGRTKEAEAAFREFHRIMAERAQAAPQDRGRQLDLAIADGRMSLMHEQAGRIADAVSAAATEHETVKNLALAVEGKDRSLQLHLAATHERLGDLAVIGTQPDDAARHFQESHRLLNALLQIHPKEESVIRPYAMSLERLADLHHASGRFSEALELHQKEVQVLDELLRSNEGDGTLRRTIAKALLKLAADHQGIKQPPLAERALSRSLALLIALSEADPGNLQILYDLSIAHWSLAQFKVQEGTRESVSEATTHYQRGRELLEHLDQRNALNATTRPMLQTFDEAISDCRRLMRL